MTISFSSKSKSPYAVSKDTRLNNLCILSAARDRLMADPVANAALLRKLLVDFERDGFLANAAALSRRLAYYGIIDG